MAHYTDLVSPQGIGGFSNVVRENKTFGGYSYQLYLDPKLPETQTFLEDLQQRFADSIEKEKAEHPKAKVRELNINKVSEKDPKDLQELDLIKLNFKSKNEPRLYDGNGNAIQLEREPGIGSQVRVAITTRSYTFANISGMTLYINGLYVLENAQPKPREEPTFVQVPQQATAVDDIGL